MTKKLMGLLLGCVLLLCTAVAEEGFVLHNGVTFDMSLDEIRMLEAQCGLVMQVERHELTAFLTGRDTIAGQPDTGVTYYFRDGRLLEVCYTFVSYGKREAVTAFDAIEGGLTERFGGTEYSSRTGAAYPMVKGFSPFDSNADGAGYNARFIRRDFSHRLVKLSDTRYVFIQHYVSEYRYQVYGMQYNSAYTHQVVFMLLEGEPLELLLEELNAAVEE